MQEKRKIKMIQFNLKNLTPNIITYPQTMLLTKGLIMSFAEDKTPTLWKTFSPLIKNISHRDGNEKFSVQVYPNADFFTQFKITNTFKKYAGVKVLSHELTNNDLELLIIPEGLYAEFDYIGKPSLANDTYRYIFYDWLPSSPYQLDSRPHLAIMSEKYKGEVDDSEEKLLIPIIGS